MNLFPDTTYFYHSHMRRAISVFGYVFSGISIARFNSLGKVEKMITPIPITLIGEDTDLALNIEGVNTGEGFKEVFPRMTYQMTNIGYNPSRRHSKNNRVSYSDEEGNVRVATSPSPHVISFSLNIITKTQFDAQQIFEQIVPAFAPYLIIKVKDHPVKGAIFDMPISLTGVTFEDNFADFENAKRRVIYSMDFDVMLNFYGPTGSQIEYDAIIQNIISSAGACGFDVGNDIDNLRGRDDEVDRMFERLDAIGKTENSVIREVVLSIEEMERKIYRDGPFGPETNK